MEPTRDSYVIHEGGRIGGLGRQYLTSEATFKYFLEADQELQLPDAAA